MTERTEVGWRVSHGTSSVQLLDFKEFVLACDWVSDNPRDGFLVFKEAERFAEGMKVLVTVEGNEKLEKFYRKRGFVTGALVKNE